MVMHRDNSCMAHMCFKGNCLEQCPESPRGSKGGGGLEIKAPQRLKSALCQGFTSPLDCSDGDGQLDKMKNLK